LLNVIVGCDGFTITGVGACNFMILMFYELNVLLTFIKYINLVLDKVGD